MTTENLCRCGKPTRDTAVVCDDCGDSLARALGDVAWLTDELEISVTRQKGVDYRQAGGGSGPKKPSERPSPVQWGAAEARAELRSILVSWTRLCADEGVRNSSPYPGLPDDDLASISRWLLWRVDGLTLHEAGSDAVDEITSAVAHCHRVIDRPADRQYLGVCDVCPDGRLYSRPGGKWARCATCDATTAADEVRSRLLGELDDRLCTAAEIAHLSTYLGLKAGREQVRKRIEYWARSERIHSEAAISEQAVYRFGIVWRLLAQEDRKNLEKAS